MKHDISDIKATVKDLICRELKLEPQIMTAQNNLREIPGMESLKILRVILCIEEHYGIELEEEVVFSVNTIEDIAVAVASLMNRQSLQVAGGGSYA